MNPVSNPNEKISAGKKSSPAYVVLTGNPNCGKTTVFNALTGMHAKVGNYAGVTVERKEGKLLGVDGRARHSVRAEAESQEGGARGATRPTGETPTDIRV